MDALTTPRTVDAQGRPAVEEMSERELLEETVKVLRAVGDALAPLTDPELTKLGPIGMMKALMLGGK